MSEQKDREIRIREVVQSVERGNSSVKEVADDLGLSKSHVRGLLKEAREKGLIKGEKSVPIPGYIFERDARKRTDGGDRNGELRVLTTREGLLQAVQEFAPHLYSEARGMSLEDLRKLVRDRVAAGTTIVSEAWRFHPI